MFLFGVKERIREKTSFVPRIVRGGEIKDEIYNEPGRYKISNRYSHNQLKAKAYRIVCRGKVACAICGLEDLELLSLIMINVMDGRIESGGRSMSVF